MYMRMARGKSAATHTYEIGSHSFHIWEVEQSPSKIGRENAVSAAKNSLSFLRASCGWVCLGPAAAAMVGAMGLTRKATCHSLMSAAPIDETDVVRAVPWL